MSLKALEYIRHLDPFFGNLDFDFRCHNAYRLKTSCLIIHMLTSISNFDFLNSFLDAMNLSYIFILEYINCQFFILRIYFYFYKVSSPKFWDQFFSPKFLYNDLDQSLKQFLATHVFMFLNFSEQQLYLY